MKILVIDVGGTHVKALCTGQVEPRKIVSGKKMTPEKMVKGISELVAGWEYDVVSIGYPSFAFRGRTVCEPANLGGGWVGFDFEGAFKCPVRLMNDAAMQALGSYEGGRMLFLGLGTGLGTAVICEGVVEPLELGHLVYKRGKSYEDYVGLAGLMRLGKKRWRETVHEIVEQLKTGLGAEYAVLGGGNARLLKDLPPGSRLGANANAFEGGYRLWNSCTWSETGQVVISPTASSAPI